MKKIHKKALKGMPFYFEKVENINFGKSPIDFLMINTPPICNYRCKKCFTWASSREVKNPLSLEEIFSTIDKGKKLGAKVVCVIGEGEPLVYRYFKEIIAYINDLKMTPLIATNGKLLGKEMADYLFKYNTTIVVSLDTLNEKEYKEFCGGNADISIVLKNIEYVRKLFSKKIYKKKNYRIYQFAIHMTVTANNYRNLKDIEDFCAEDIYFDCQPLAIIGNAERNVSCVGNRDTYGYYQLTSKKLYPPMVLTKTEKNEEVCCLFYYGLAIGYDGEVMIDTHAIDSKCIGNIREYSVDDLLERVRKLRRVFMDKYATGYCPVRDKNYKKFLKFLKNNPK